MAAFGPPSAHFCGSDGGSEEAAGVRQGRLASVAGGQARVMAVEHEETKWGEALMASEHSAWRNGTSKTLYDVLGAAAPASLVGVGITRVEHLCRPGDMGGGAFEFTPFAVLVKTWGLSSSHKVRVEWGKLLLELRERCLDTSPWSDEGMGNRV